jgi:hypothetical protein
MHLPKRFIIQQPTVMFHPSVFQCLLHCLHCPLNKATLETLVTCQE